VVNERMRGAEHAACGCIDAGGGDGHDAAAAGAPERLARQRLPSAMRRREHLTVRASPPRRSGEFSAGSRGKTAEHVAPSRAPATDERAPNERGVDARYAIGPGRVNKYAVYMLRQTG